MLPSIEGKRHVVHPPDMGGLCTEFGPVLELEGLVIVERRSGAPAPKKWKKQQANLPSQTATFPSQTATFAEPCFRGFFRTMHPPWELFWAFDHLSTSHTSARFSGKKGPPLLGFTGVPRVASLAPYLVFGEAHVAVENNKFIG